MDCPFVEHIPSSHSSFVGQNLSVYFQDATFSVVFAKFIQIVAEQFGHNNQMLLSDSESGQVETRSLVIINLCVYITWGTETPQKSGSKANNQVYNFCNLLDMHATITRFSGNKQGFSSKTQLFLKVFNEYEEDVRQPWP